MEECCHIPLLSNRVFLFTFSSHEDMIKIYEGLTSFVFDKLLLVRKYEVGMHLSKNLFSNSPVWIELPSLPLEYWTPKSISKIANVIWEPVLADRLTVMKLRLDFARVLVNVHNSECLNEDIQIRTSKGVLNQKVVYEWSPKPCKKCLRWGHKEAECDPLKKKNKVFQQKKRDKEPDLVKLVQPDVPESSKIMEDRFHIITSRSS